MQENDVTNRVRTMFSHAREHFDDGCDELGLGLYLKASELLPHVPGAQAYLNLVLEQRDLCEQYVVPIFLDPCVLRAA